MPIHKAEQCCLSLVPSGFRGEYRPSHKLSPIRDTHPVPRRRILPLYGANAGGSADLAGSVVCACLKLTAVTIAPTRHTAVDLRGSLFPRCGKTSEAAQTVLTTPVSRRRTPLPLPLHPFDHLRQHRLALLLAVRVDGPVIPRPIRIPG